MQTRQNQIASVYFHIGNGGISVDVLQNERDVEGSAYKSPALKISAHHFGQQTNGMEFQIRPEAIRALGEVLIEASNNVLFENDSQIVVENPRNIIVGNEVWNKTDYSAVAGSAEQSQPAGE